MKQKIGQHLDPLFVGFWNQLGSMLGGFWRPSWTQVGTKWHQHPTTQPIKKIIIFWKASGWFFNEFLIDYQKFSWNLICALLKRYGDAPWEEKFNFI